MDPDEIVTGLRERGHHVGTTVKDGETMLEIDGRLTTLKEAEGLLTEEIEVEEP